ncbi:hypothetical protein HOLleu_07025 [Holothuria leucospilota]|uniref:Uncharacterized protein n=1 Tax=Holothuria leucospilota TaxID=206669 RepID=A0A9Q1HFC0_HOLLE|nr:hypothetical protein HOLleu_07025 [Holothuria leucospilota]
MEKYRQYIRGFPTCVSIFSHHLKSSPEFASLIRRLQECTDENSPDQYHLTCSLKQLKQIVKKINLLVKRTKSEENSTRSHSSSELPNELNEGHNNDMTVTMIATPPETRCKTVNSDKTGTNLREESNNLPTGEHRDLSNQESKSGVKKDEHVTSKRTGRRRSLSAYMLEIPEEPISTCRQGLSLSPSRFEQLRLENSQETVAESSDNDSQEGDVESCAAMLSKEVNVPHDTTSFHGDDLSQEELELIGKPPVNKQVYLVLEAGNTPQRAPSFGVYGDLDWKGEGGEYVPSAIEMKFPSNMIQCQTRWRNNPANQPIRQQSDKTESEYHTSDDEPIPINSPMYDVPMSDQPSRGLEKRRRSSIGELMVIPPQQEDKSFCIQWETIDTTSDENTEDEGLLSGGKKTEDIFEAVSHQRKKFGMRRRSIDASDPSIRGSMGGSRVSVATPRESWMEERKGQQRNYQSLGDKIIHPLKNVLKRGTVNNDNKVLRSNDVTDNPTDVMQQLAEIARMIVESSESPTKNKDPCSNV